MNPRPAVAAYLAARPLGLPAGVTVTPLPRTAAVNRAYGPGLPLYVVRVPGTGPGAGTFTVAAASPARALRAARVTA